MPMSSKPIARAHRLLNLPSSNKISTAESGRRVLLHYGQVPNEATVVSPKLGRGMPPFLAEFTQFLGQRASNGSHQVRNLAFHGLQQLLYNLNQRPRQNTATHRFDHRDRQIQQPPLDPTQSLKPDAATTSLHSQLHQLTSRQRNTSPIHHVLTSPS